jgi:hypothetical protein
MGLTLCDRGGMLHVAKLTALGFFRSRLERNKHSCQPTIGRMGGRHVVVQQLRYVRMAKTFFRQVVTKKDLTHDPFVRMLGDVQDLDDDRSAAVTVRLDAQRAAERALRKHHEIKVTAARQGTHRCNDLKICGSDGFRCNAVGQENRQDVEFVERFVLFFNYCMVKQNKLIRNL